MGPFLALAVCYSYIGGEELVYLILLLRIRPDIRGILQIVIWLDQVLAYHFMLY